MVLFQRNHGVASGESCYCVRGIMVLFQRNHGVVPGES